MLIEVSLVICSDKEKVLIALSVFSLIGVWVFVFSVLSIIEVFCILEGLVVLSIISLVAWEIIFSVFSPIWEFVDCSVISLLEGTFVICSLSFIEEEMPVRPLLSIIEVLVDV